MQNDEQPNCAGLSTEHEQYFSEYKWLKATDTLTEEFVSKVKRISLEKGASVFQMQSRNHFVSEHYDEHTSILFVDGMGIEYVDYLAHLFSDLDEQQYSVFFDAGFCTLPSVTEINKDFIEKWVKVMKRSGLSITSVAIALRMFRTIVNICITRGLIHGNTKEMFQGTGYNKSQSRKHEFLDVATMRQLYDFWEKEEVKDENGKELFFPKEKNAVFRDLGLFLFMYLGDGQNLADTLRLTYDGWYSSSKGKQMRFLRHKTRERNESASEVIFPITPEIQKIIDRYGNKPKKGARVFPIMKTDITPEQEVWVIQRYNRSIREHMAKIADLLGMEQVPSPTWARHSFATNLNNSGMVPYKYISDSMGHSSSGDITANYIGAYPPETMLEYNWYLLHDKSEKIQQPVVGKQALLEMLKNMSEEERKDLLSSL